MISSPVYIGAHVAQSLVFLCSDMYVIVAPFSFFTIVCSVLRRFTLSGYHCGISKLLVLNEHEGSILLLVLFTSKKHYGKECL